MAAMRVCNKLRSLSIRASTGSAVMLIAVPMNKANCGRGKLVGLAA
jgi:hypothetical protein